jgi:hypothetical protein
LTKVFSNSRLTFLTLLTLSTVSLILLIVSYSSGLISALFTSSSEALTMRSMSKTYFSLGGSTGLMTTTLTGTGLTTLTG